MTSRTTCPAELSKTVVIHGHLFTIRPICSEDAPLLREMVRRSDREDIRLRFFAPVRDIPQSFSDRLSHLDHDHNMAFVALEKQKQVTGQTPALAGMVCILGDPKSDTVEYAVMVRSDLKGQGLGYRLMKEILIYAGEKGLKHVTGKVLCENSPMLKMVREFGGKIGASADPCAVVVDFDLGAPGRPPL